MKKLTFQSFMKLYQYDVNFEPHIAEIKIKNKNKAINFTSENSLNEFPLFIVPSMNNELIQNLKNDINSISIASSMNKFRVKFQTLYADTHSNEDWMISETINSLAIENVHSSRKDIKSIKINNDDKSFNNLNIIKNNWNNKNNVSQTQIDKIFNQYIEKLENQEDNNALAYFFATKFIKNFQNITPYIIHKTYMIMTNNQKYIKDGKDHIKRNMLFRNDDVQIVNESGREIDRGASHKNLKVNMEDFCKILNDNLNIGVNLQSVNNINEKLVIDAENVISLAHYLFVAIHPFFDGNGRMGRIIMQWVMFRFYDNSLQFTRFTNPMGYNNFRESLFYISEPINVLKNDYYWAIRATKYSGDINYLLLFISYAFYLYNYVDLHAFKSVCFLYDVKYQRSRKKYYKYMKFIFYLIDKQNDEFDWRTLEQKADIKESKQTILNTLNEMVNVGLLKFRSTKKTKLFSLSEELIEYLNKE